MIEKGYITSRARRAQTDIAHCNAVGSDAISRQMQPEGLQHNQCNRHNVAALQAAFDGGVVYTHSTQGVAAGLHLLWHSVPHESLKGSDKYSVWQRHTTMASRNYGQPERLQHNHCNRHNVAALQAAYDGGVVCTHSTQGVATGLHLLWHSVPHESLKGSDKYSTQGDAAGLHLLWHSVPHESLKATSVSTPVACRMFLHSVPHESLKGSNKYSVWQRHTTMASRNHGQPERLQHNQCNRHNVAALQAASACVTRHNPRALPLGYICSSPSGWLTAAMQRKN